MGYAPPEGLVDLIDSMKRAAGAFAAADMLATKILALSEQDPNIRPIARTLREQVDWELLRATVGDTPFGAAVLTLVERLGIASSEVVQA
jgi:hypothetical protein